MDDESYQYLRSLKSESIITISHLQLESHYAELLAAKKNRSRVEYYFTCSSAICSFIFDSYPGIELLTYLDADLYFFSSPEPIYKELKDASVGIIEHSFSFFGKRYLKYGRFNVGWVSFRNDQSGRKCLEDWRQNCLQWCYDRLEAGKFADQKYLDYWPEQYSGVHIIKHPGANLAPWNVGRFRLKLDPNSHWILVNDQNLIFYHFASFKQVGTNSYITNVSKYLVPLTGVLRNNIYIPYLRSLVKYNEVLSIKFNHKNRSELISSSIKSKFKNASRNLRKFICRDYIKI
ncbi:MAG: hypothetical protein M3R50_03915 [Bacteroidota bacterium]|nr:hypothetical protein [Bacteroidota bacterium]